MEVVFLSETVVLGLIPQKDQALISISEPGRHVQLPHEDQWGALLRLNFSDAEYDVGTFTRQAARGVTFNPAAKGFPVKSDAVLIRDFVGQLAASGDERGITSLIVHCKAGQRRSAAVAKYAADVLGCAFDHEYANFNRTVYALLMEPGCFDGVAFHSSERKERVWQRIACWLGR